MTTPLISPPKLDEENSLYNYFTKFNFSTPDTNVLEHFQNNVSSLYFSQPQFNYPVLRFKETETEWKTLAKEVLTPFAPQYPIYDYQKFIPEKHKNRLGFQFITTMRTERSDSPFLPEKSAMKINPFGITLHPSIKDDKKSHAAAHHKVSFKDLPLENTLALKNAKSIERFSNQPYINSQHFSIGSRAELLRADDGRNSPFIRDFLIRKQTPNNSGLIPTQQRRKTLEDTRSVRPQSSADVLRRRDDQLLHFDEGALIGNSRRGSEESILQDPKGLDFIRNHSPSKNEKRKSPSLLGTLKLLQNTLKAGTPKSRLVTPRSSKLQTGMVTPRSRQGTPKSREGPITLGERSYGRFSNLYEERSREYSLINELKCLRILRKPTFEEDKLKQQVERNHLNRHIRRKSDVSKYSGGECLKLAKNGDIVLAADFAKKSVAFSGANLIALKKKNVSNIKTKDPSSHNEENHAFKGPENEVKSVVFDLPSSAQCSDSSSPQTKSSNQSPNRQAQLLRSDSLYRKVLQPKMRVSINPDPILAGRSPHSGSTSRPKTRESLPRKSEPEVMVIKDLLGPMNKDLGQGLKTVLNLTSGAKKVLFTTNSERRSKTPIMTYRVKDLAPKRQAIKPLNIQEPLTSRDLSPYLGAQSFRGNDSRVTRIFNQEPGRITPNKLVIKKDENIKIKVFQKRHHSLPKVIGIETLLQK